VVPRFGQVEQLLDAADLVLGGSAAITACGLARLGVETHLAAVVGADQFGAFVRSALAAAGVGMDAMAEREGEATGLSVHLSAPGDRAILTLPGTIPALTADAVRSSVADLAPTWVHVASPFLTPAVTSDLPALLAELRDAGIGTSLDTNWDPAENWAGIAEALPFVDVLLPNRAELDALGGVDAIIAAGPRVVVKDGAEGGWSVSRSEDRISAPGLSIDVVDTTGAGDSFDAGYLAAIAHGVEDERTRLRWATVAGSLSTRSSGGTGGQATLDELTAAL
jgi:sugar/nucleoside kinase (ribokinase family)